MGWELPPRQRRPLCSSWEDLIYDMPLLFFLGWNMGCMVWLVYTYYRS